MQSVLASAALLLAVFASTLAHAEERVVGVPELEVELTFDDAGGCLCAPEVDSPGCNEENDYGCTVELVALAREQGRRDGMEMILAGRLPAGDAHPYVSVIVLRSEDGSRFSAEKIALDVIAGRKPGKTNRGTIRHDAPFDIDHSGELAVVSYVLEAEDSRDVVELVVGAHALVYIRIEGRAPEEAAMIALGNTLAAGVRMPAPGGQGQRENEDSVGEPEPEPEAPTRPASESTSAFDAGYLIGQLIGKLLIVVIPIMVVVAIFRRRKR